MRNQYFQLEYRDTNVYLHIYPSIDDGQLLNISEVMEYLAMKKIENYDLKEINAAIIKNEETFVFVGYGNGLPEHEQMKTMVSLDRMKAVCRLYPPSKGGKLLNAEDIISELAFRKVRFGIDKSAIEEFLADRKYCTDYVFAVGMQPIHGRDAKIEYFFNTNKNLQPKRNEDGSVDYKELNTISHVKKGDLLARLIKEDAGKMGRTVYDEEVRPRTVRSLRLEFGKNIAINEERTEIYSEVTGHATCINGNVFVSDVFEVPADVDNSVGNIDYDGSVEIRGNIKTGFSVRATGDIVVHGVVENAYVESGGQIIVKQGIHGMYKGILKAATNVMSKYIENATVIAGGFVEAEAILNSDVAAADEVRVHGKKGLINGGVTRAGKSIEVEYAGTEMGTVTTLEVGVDPGKKERYLELRKDVAQRTEELEKMKVILDNYTSLLKRGEVLPKDKLLYVQQLAVEYKKQKQEIEPLKEEQRLIHTEMMQSNRSYIIIGKSVYPGVAITISDVGYIVKNKMNRCRFRKASGEVQTVTL